MSELTELEKTLYRLGYTPKTDDDLTFEKQRRYMWWRKFYSDYQLRIYVVKDKIDYFTMSNDYISTEKEAQYALSAFHQLQKDLEELKNHES